MIPTTSFCITGSVLIQKEAPRQSKVAAIIHKPMIFWFYAYSIYPVFCISTYICKPACGRQNMAWNLHSHRWQIMHKATSKISWLNEEREAKKKKKGQAEVIKLKFLSTYILPEDVLCSYRSLHVKKKAILYDCEITPYWATWKDDRFHTVEKMKIRHYNFAENYFIKPTEILILPLKHWIHFRRSSRCPPTSNILRKKHKSSQSESLCVFCVCMQTEKVRNFRISVS